jgi:hypothetical protein
MHGYNADSFEKTASGIQNCALTVALLIGGYWTYHTFNAQLQVQNAQAQLEKLKHEIELEPRVEVTLDVKQIAPLSYGERGVTGRISVKNVGNKDTALTNPSLTVYRVRFDEEGDEVWFKRRVAYLFMDDCVIVGNLTAQVDATNSASFIALVQEPGLYVAVFSADRRKEEKESALALGERRFNSEVAWQAQSYLVVK